MQNATQTIQNIHLDRDNSVNNTGLRVLQTESNDPVKGLCINCSNYPRCTFPMRGKALLCEEYE
jgi:hypothetical protein